MADAWPSSVPGPDIDSVSYKPAFDNTVRSQMDVGRKVRRRATAVPEILTCSLYLTHAQLQTLLDFYEITLKQTLPFTWFDWRKPNDTATPVVCSFNRYPEHARWGFEHWQVSLELTQWTTFQGTYLLDVDPLTT